MLPPLAGLALGTPTAVGNDDDEADSDAEHEYERLDQRAHRKFPTLMPAPEKLVLTDLPHAVVGIIVEQAAKAARPAGPVDSLASKNSALSMCTWMKSFCRAAKVQGLPCDDDWFRLALGAFSDFVPGRSAMPMGSPFRTWRQLFGVLCNALNEKHSIFPNEQLSMNFIRRIGYPAHNNGLWMWNWWASTSQRDLDTVLRALFESQMGPNSLADIQEAVRALFHSPPFQVLGTSAPSPWMAFAIMLLMRGANPHGWDDWNDQDVQLYVAIVQGMTFQLPWEEGGEERIRELLLAGANPSYNGSTVRRAGFTAPPSPSGMRAYPHVLQLAVYSTNKHLLNALLDAGASVSHRDDVVGLLKALKLATLRPGWWSNERFPVDRATTERLLVNVLRPALLTLTGISREHARNVMEAAYDEAGQDGVINWVYEVWRDMVQWAEANGLYEAAYDSSSSSSEE